MYQWLIAFVLLFTVPALAAETRGTIPEQFRGTWAATAAHCAAVGAESKLSIHKTGIDFYESRGRLLAIAVDGETELALLIELSGEGDTWLEAMRFTLSEDHHTLTDVTGRRRGSVRVRCRANAVEP